jgi:hypothetical protein
MPDEKGRGVRQHRRRQVDAGPLPGGVHWADVVPARQTPVQGRWRRDSPRGVLEATRRPSRSRRVDHRWLWLCRLGVGAVLGRRYAGVRRPTLFTHFRWVTKRLAQSPFASPEGWPENSPMWISTLNSYRVLWRCHRGLTPRYRQLVVEAAASKRVHHLRSPADMRTLLHAVQQEQPRV